MADVGVRPLNSRSLLLSVLLGLPTPRLPAPAPARLAELFGIAPGTMRTAISRMLASGELTTVDGGLELHGDRLLARKWAQDIGRRPPAGAWDGSWLVVTVLATSRSLADRRDFRTAMANARLAELRPDTWLRPANLPPPAVVDEVLLGRGTLVGTEASSLVSTLWDLDALGARSVELKADLDRGAVELRSRGPAALPLTMPIAAAVVRFLRAEPLLPPELTPSPWPVDDLRRRYARFDRDFGRVLRTALT